MTPLGLVALLLSLSALFGVVNDRTLRLPNTIGVLAIALLASLALLAVAPLIPGADLHALSRDLLGAIDLPRTLLGGALSLLLFAGALQVDLGQLLARWRPVLALALVGTLLSIGLFGAGMWLLFPLADRAVPFGWCLVLGAILAPTDPVSVIGMLRRIGLPAPLRAVFEGESLFNDGVGVVAFGVALAVVGGGADPAMIGAGPIIGRFLLEAAGGGVLGLVLGRLATWMMGATEDAHLELIISLALATGTFSLAGALHMSGPIAVVVAGLAMRARHGRAAISPDGRETLEAFWTLIDEVLNALLFLLIGFEVLALSLHLSHVLAALCAIPLSVAVRALSVTLATLPLHASTADGPIPGGRQRSLVLLSWGALRGGISVSLALGLPDGPERAPLLTVCYAVVVFTILVQGLTVERLARRLYPPG